MSTKQIRDDVTITPAEIAEAAARDDTSTDSSTPWPKAVLEAEGKTAEQMDKLCAKY